jgi:hypothetical protein
MASNRIGFNQFLKIAKEAGDLNILIDSNILISRFDEAHTHFEVVESFLNDLTEVADITFFTTVTTKAEFLDYQRRRFLTTGLFDLVSSEREEKQLKQSSKQKINQMKARRGKRSKDEETRSVKYSDAYDSSVDYLQDSDLKEIKKHFRARSVQSEIGWLKVCEFFLANKLADQEALLNQFCNYLSAHDDSQAHLFKNRNIDWKKATSLSATTGMGYSDALILNMFSETTMDYLITLDYDLIYAVSVSAKDKYVVLPDARLSSFKQTLKKM